jgi:MFS family permease
MIHIPSFSAFHANAFMWNFAISSAEQRGSAMALGGLGWGLSNFSTPLITGTLTDTHGIRAAFYVLGVIVLLVGLVLPAMQRWAFRGTELPL